MPSPIFANAPFTFEEMIATRSAEEAATLARYVAPTNVVVEHATVPVFGYEIPIRIYRSANSNNQGQAPLFIWHHGGAFMGGGLNMPEAHVTAHEVAARSGALVVSVDYRLCNDDIKFPTPQRDALAVAMWLLRNQVDLNFDPKRLFLGGASAGACLVGSLAMLLRDGGVPVAGVVPVYGVGHLEELAPSEELIKHCEAGLGHPVHLMTGHNAWLMPEDPDECAGFHVWPGSESDYRDLPKHFFIHADFDILRSTGEPWAQQLRDAGVEVIEVVETGTAHGFLNDLPNENLGQNLALDRIAKFIEEN
jgi:acetyl esterase